MNISHLNRRTLLSVGAGGGEGAAAGALPRLLAQESATPAPSAGEKATPGTEHGGHFLSSTVGDVDIERLGWDPSEFVSTFDYGELTTMQDGTVVREWNLAGGEHEIEIAPGVFFPAWSFNGQVPGPTLRANEGDRLRINFVNGSTHPHTMHFHGIHSAFHDGVPGIGRGELLPGESHTYEFKAEPYGCHLYHCHANPLKRHVHKAMHGAYIVNPDRRSAGIWRDRGIPTIPNRPSGRNSSR